MQTAPLCLSLALAVSLAVPAKAQSPGTPGVVTGGANGVTFNGKPAARTGDQTSGCPK